MFLQVSKKFTHVLNVVKSDNYIKFAEHIKMSYVV